MEQSARMDVWAAGNLYEPFVGRWSRRVAREFLVWLSIPTGRDWLDVGCGTGALTQTILDLAEPRSVSAVDPSPGFVEYARAHVMDARVGAPGARATFAVGDAQSLATATGTIDAAISGLVLNFVPEPARGVAEMARATRSGGQVAAYVWDYAGRMELLRVFWDAAAELDPTALALDEGRRFPICQPQALTELFAEAGLQSVEVRPIDVATDFRDFDELWSPFLGGQGPAPGYAMSLDEARRSALRDRIRAKLPVAGDGAIHLVARAWAVRGRRV